MNYIKNILKNLIIEKGSAFFTIFVLEQKECPICGFTLPSKYVKEGLAEKIYGEWKETAREYLCRESS